MPTDPVTIHEPNSTPQLWHVAIPDKHAGNAEAAVPMAVTREQLRRGWTTHRCAAATIAIGPPTNCP